MNNEFWPVPVWSKFHLNKSSNSRDISLTCSHITVPVPGATWWSIPSFMIDINLWFCCYLYTFHPLSSFRSPLLEGARWCNNQHIKLLIYPPGSMFDIFVLYFTCTRNFCHWNLCNLSRWWSMLYTSRQLSQICLVLEEGSLLSGSFLWFWAI